MTVWSRLVKRVANIVINLFMENREQQILSEIKALMSSVRLQLEQLDMKMAELQQVYDPQSVEVEEIDLEFDMPEMAFAAAEVAVAASTDMPEDIEEECVEPASEEPVEDDSEESVSAEENIEEQPVEPVEDVDDLPFYDAPDVDLDESEAAEIVDELEDVVEIVEVPEAVDVSESVDIPETVEAPEVIEDVDLPEEEDLPLFAVEEEAPVTLLETAMAASSKSAVISPFSASIASPGGLDSVSTFSSITSFFFCTFFAVSKVITSTLTLGSAYFLRRLPRGFLVSSIQTLCAPSFVNFPGIIISLSQALNSSMRFCHSSFIISLSYLLL